MGNRLCSRGKALTSEKRSPSANVCAIAGRGWNARLLPGCSPNIWDRSPDKLSTMATKVLCRVKLPSSAPQTPNTESHFLVGCLALATF